MVDRIVLFSVPLEELKEMIGQILEEKLKEFYMKTVPTTPPQKEFLSREEVCELLHINLVTLWRYTKDGRLKQHRIGKRVFFRAEEVRDAMKIN